MPKTAGDRIDGPLDGSQNRRMKLVTAVLVAVILAPAAAQSAAGQSLADVAKREETRRKQVQGGKVYTNRDLKPDPQPAAPPTPAAAPAAADTPKTDAKAEAGSTDKGGAVAGAPDPKKDEAYWRKRVTTARDGLARAQTFQDALQARVNAFHAGPEAPAVTHLIAPQGYG